MKENLLISPLGNDSLCHTWISEKSNFDSVFLCYENLSKENKSKYLKFTSHIYEGRGPKFQLIKAFIESNKELINKSNDQIIIIHVLKSNDQIRIIYLLQICASSGVRTPKHVCIANET